MKGIVALITFPAWIIGIFLAKGFWSTFFAIFIPLWSWYLTAEFLVTKYLL